MHFYKALKPVDSDQARAYDDLCPDTYRTILAFDVVVLVILAALARAFLRWQPNASK
jgi:peptide subunit release factor RF-3